MSISISEVVAITGQPGLHRLLKTNDKAIVVESLDGKGKRQLIKGNMMVSKLTDVSIYTHDDSEPLLAVLKTIQERYQDQLPVKRDSSSAELLNFMAEVLPSFDQERVYPSNIKKLVGWYEILVEQQVSLEVAEEPAAEEGSPEAEAAPEPEAEPDAQPAPAPKKPAAKKKAAEPSAE